MHIYLYIYIYIYVYIYIYIGQYMFTYIVCVWCICSWRRLGSCFDQCFGISPDFPPLWVVTCLCVCFSGGGEGEGRGPFILNVWTLLGRNVRNDDHINFYKHFWHTISPPPSRHTIAHTHIHAYTHKWTHTHTHAHTHTHTLSLSLSNRHTHLCRYVLGNNVETCAKLLITLSLSLTHTRTCVRACVRTHTQTHMYAGICWEKMSKNVPNRLLKRPKLRWV